jgi:hypothetical protein
VGPEFTASAIIPMYFDTARSCSFATAVDVTACR